MDTKTIKVLLIEDNPDDVFFLRMVLRKIDGTNFQLEPAEDLAKGLQAPSARGRLTSFSWI